MQRLGDELRRLRREHRLGSQEELAQLSGVSAATIKKLEAGATGEVKPSTLRLLARGLATDFDARVDPDRTERLYARLMRAAGFLPAETEAEPTISREAFVRDMAERTGRRDLAIALSSVAWDYDQIPARYRAVLEAAILAAAQPEPE